MKAAVLTGLQEITLEERALPEPQGKKPVLVRVGAVGVCGSDVLRYGVGKGYGYPLVLGHELSGTVQEAGAGSHFKAADRVAIFPCLPDESEPMSEIGEFALGTQYDYFGSRRDGGLQEFISVPERNLFALPAETPLVIGAMVEPAGVALHAMRKVEMPANASALVIGAGPIGCLAAQWLRVLGATRVIVADIDTRKRQVAELLGFETIDASAGPTDEIARELTGGRGVDIAVEASGLPVTFTQALGAAAHRGQVVLLGDLSGDAAIDKKTMSSILRRELILYGTWNARITPRFNSEWDMVIASMTRSLNLRDLVSHVFPLEEAPEVFRRLADRDLWSNKVAFAVSDEAKAEAADVLSNSASARLAALS